MGAREYSGDAALTKVARCLLKAKRILLTTHLEPDGDGIGGMLALAGLLTPMGKHVTLYSSDPIPYNLHFLPGSHQIRTTLPEKASFDATCIIDTFSFSMVGPLPPRKRLGTLLQIDHHKTQELTPDAALLDPKSSSVGELIYRLSFALGAPISREVAKHIYCAIFCDTGSFRYAKTTPEALRVAADMVERGADPWEMTANIHESHPVSRNRLLGEALRTLTLSDDGRCAAICLTRDMYEKTGANDALTDGFINFARGVAGVEVAVQLSEVQQEVFQVAFRSRGRVDVSRIAAAFGGGGKKNAAGCRLEGEPNAILQRIFDEATRHVCYDS